MTNQTVAVVDFPKILRIGEAAHFLHVHPNTLRKWSSNGLIPTYRIGNRRDRRFKVEDLASFLDNGANGPNGQQ